MSNRVSKQYSRKTHAERELERLKKDRDVAKLAESVALSGEQADMPCTRCFRAGTGEKCLMSPDSSRCSECVRKRKPCDGTRVASSRESISFDLLFLIILTFLSFYPYEAREEIGSGRRRG